MMRTRLGLGLWLCALCLAGCAVSAPPISHLQLSSMSSGRASADVPRLFLDQVRLPDFLLRDELIHRDDDFSLRYDPYLRWAEPLDLGIQRVLAEELAIAADTRQVTRFPDPAGPGTDWRLRVEIDRFERRGDAVQLRGRGYWSAPDEPDSVLASVDFDQRQGTANASPSATAGALSRLLADFAQALAGALPTRP